MDNSFELHNKVAQDILNKPTDKIIELFKVRGAGVTISLCLNAYRQKKKILIVVPTNAIAQETIINKLKELEPNINIIQATDNRQFCLKLSNECKKYPSLRNMKFCLKCRKCKYPKCDYQKFVKNRYDIKVLTYSKLVGALKNEKMLNAILDSDVIILDEIVMGLLKKGYITIKTKAKYRIEMMKRDFEKFLPYSKAFNLNNTMKDRFWEAVGFTILEIQDKISMLEKSQKEKYLGPFNNTWHDEIKEFNLNIKVIWRHIQELNKKGYRTDLLEELALILKCEKYFIIKDGDNIKLTTFEKNDLDNLKKLPLIFKNKLIVITDAGYPYEIDFSKLLGQSTERITFGEGGDILGTNKKLLIVADTKQVSANIFYRDTSLQQRAKNFLDRFENEDTIKASLNKYISNKLSIQHYYRHSELRGIEQKKRRGVFIMPPNIPKHSYITIALNFMGKIILDNTPISDVKKISEILNRIEERSTFINNVTRIKDSAGNEKSIAFCWGIKIEKVRDLLYIPNVYMPFIIQPLREGEFEEFPKLFEDLWRKYEWNEHSCKDISILASLIRRIHKQVNKEMNLGTFLNNNNFNDHSRKKVRKQMTLSMFPNHANFELKVKEIVRDKLKKYSNILEAYGITIKRRGNANVIFYNKDIK